MNPGSAGPELKENDMRVWTSIFAAAALWTSANAGALAFDPYGIWLRPESGTKFDFYNCAGKLCAKVIDVSASDNKAAVGTVILRNAVQKEGVWHGELYNTEDGKIYKGAITVEKPTELVLEGCLIAFLCKSETWQRSPDQTGALSPNGQPMYPAPSAKPGLGH